MPSTEPDAQSVRVLACHKLNVAPRPPSLKFALGVVSLRTVEQVPVLRLLGESRYDDEAVFEQARRAFREQPPTEVESATEWLSASSSTAR